MYALAALNLSLVHPSSQNSLTVRVPPVQQTLEEPSGTRQASDPDGSVCRIANIDLSLIHPSDASCGGGESVGEPDSQVAEASATSSFLPRSPSVSMASDSDSKRNTRLSMVKSVPSNGHSREESMLSISSLGSIINSGVSDPFGYREDVSRPPQIPLPPAPSRSHGYSDSTASIPSMSSLGRVIKPGNRNPFGYAMTDGSHTRSISQTTDFSLCVDDSSLPEREAKSRKSNDSEKSQFYFQSKPPPLPVLPPAIRGHVRDDSIMSNTSLGPPVSLHNASYRRHQRNRSSNDSGSSIAHAYSVFGANGGRAIWAQHQSDVSLDSFVSDSSMPRIERPGLGDKMLDSAADYRGMPLTSITASPSASEADDLPSYALQSSFESTQDGRSDSDSLFGQSAEPSLSEESVFGAQAKHSKGNLFGSNTANSRIRPLSVFSVASATSSAREDDTMISMLGGGHVSCKLLGESFTSSPAFKAKKKRPAFQVKVDCDSSSQPSMDKPSLASQPSSKFGSERMAKVNQGVFERRSLEGGALSATAEGSDASMNGA